MEPDEPVQTDTVKPGRAIDLRLVAETIDVDVATLRTLNPSLLRMITPDDPDFVLHLPVGTSEKFSAEIADIPAGQVGELAAAPGGGGGDADLHRQEPTGLPRRRLPMPTIWSDGARLEAGQKADYSGGAPAGGDQAAGWCATGCGKETRSEGLPTSSA